MQRLSENQDWLIVQQYLQWIKKNLENKILTTISPEYSSMSMSKCDLDKNLLQFVNKYLYSVETLKKTNDISISESSEQKKLKKKEESELLKSIYG